MIQGRPPLKNGHFLLQNGLKMPILREKKCFLGSGGQFDAPPSFFAGAQLKKTCVAGLGPWTMGDSGPPPLKNRHFLPKNGLKMPILGQKQCLLGSGGQFDAPPPYFAGARLKKTCVAGLGSRKMGDSGPPPPKKWPFLLKNGLKMPILGQKQCFLGSGGQFDAPPSYFAGARLKKTCVAGLGPRTMGDSGSPPLKNGHFLPKNGLKMPILGQKQCILGWGGQFDAPQPYFAGARLKKTCVSGLGT